MTLIEFDGGMSSTLGTTKRAVSVAAIGLFALSACSGDAGATAEALIETELAEQLALGELDATCAQPDTLEEGAEFGCTATTPDGEEIRLDATFVSDDRFEVWAINAIPASSFAALESDIASVVGAEAELDIPAANVDCGSESVILEDGTTFRCELTDPTNDAVFEIIATTDGYNGETLENLRYNLGEQIR